MIRLLITALLISCYGINSPSPRGRVDYREQSSAPQSSELDCEFSPQIRVVLPRDPTISPSPQSRLYLRTVPVSYRRGCIACSERATQIDARPYHGEQHNCNRQHRISRPLAITQNAAAQDSHAQLMSKIHRALLFLREPELSLEHYTELERATLININDTAVHEASTTIDGLSQTLLNLHKCRVNNPRLKYLLEKKLLCAKRELEMLQLQKLYRDERSNLSHLTRQLEAASFASTYPQHDNYSPIDVPSYLECINVRFRASYQLVAQLSLEFRTVQNDVSTLRRLLVALEIEYSSPTLST